MVLIALYIAIGSGMPSVREYFEMNELEFFNAWPLKTLMLLLCLNLAVVTWNRIPLTPPRYGVWCIHCGIITLIVSTSLYYHFKFEGRTLIPLNQTASYFYDSGQRALYARVADRQIYGVHALPSLPRFGAYDPDDPSDQLNRTDLQNIQHFQLLGNSGKSGNELSDWLGVSEKVHLDIVGFYPYADVAQDILPDPTSSDVGIELKVTGQNGETSGSIMLSAGDPSAARQTISTTELEHRNISESSLSLIRESMKQMFRLTVGLPNQPQQTLDAELGTAYALANGDYEVTLNSYDPAFPLFGSHEPVQALTLHIVSKSPAKNLEFWRMILANRPLQTDFKMDPAKTPPFVKGNRQKEPLDRDLVLGFSFIDPADLMPSQGGEEKHTLLTAGDNDLLDIHTTFNSPAQIKDLNQDDRIIFSVDGAPVSAQVHREMVKILTRVVPTPVAQRQKDDAEAGIKQVIVVRVSCGDWSQDVAVPCNLYAAPDPATMEPFDPWTLGSVRIPGSSSPLQLQLGYFPRPMPALLTLRNFELVHYPGGSGDSGPFRDFRSTLDMQDANGEKSVVVTSSNNPIYLDSGRYIFFQAGYDPQSRFTILGVGNRPGVDLMVSGCGMIVAGLLYAFYAKPLIIRKMKSAALARAKQNSATAAKKSLQESIAS